MSSFTMTPEIFHNVQDRLTDDAKSFARYNYSTGILTVPNEYDADVTAAVAAVTSGEPAPVVDPILLRADIEALAAIVTDGTGAITQSIADLNAALSASISTLSGQIGTLDAGLATVDASVGALQVGQTNLTASLATVASQVSAVEGEVDDIQADQQSFVIPWALSSVSRRDWEEVSSITLTVAPEQAGMWVMSHVFIDQSSNGRGMAARIKVNGDIVIGTSVDGTSSIQDSMSTLAGLVRVEAGDVVTAEVAHDISNRRDLNGTFTLAKLFD